MHSPAEGVGAQCKLWFNLLMLQLFCVSQQAKQARLLAFSTDILHLFWVENSTFKFCFCFFFKDALLQIKSLTERELHTVEQTPKANLLLATDGRGKISAYF